MSDKDLGYCLNVSPIILLFVELMNQSSTMSKDALQLLAKMQANMDQKNNSSKPQTTQSLLSNIFGTQATTATVQSINSPSLPSNTPTPNIANVSSQSVNPSALASAAAAETKASEWTDEKVKTMLNLRIAYKDKFDSRAFKKNKLWDEIASQVNGQFPGTKLTGSMCNDKFRYLKHRYLLSEQYRRVYGTTDGGLKQADRRSPENTAGAQDENSIRAPHFIYGNEFNHLFGNDLDTLQKVCGKFSLKILLLNYSLKLFLNFFIHRKN